MLGILFALLPRRASLSYFVNKHQRKTLPFFFAFASAAYSPPTPPLPPSHPRPLLLGPVWCHLLRVLILLCSRCWRLTHNFLCLFGLRIVFPPYPVNYDLPRYGRYADRMMMDDQKGKYQKLVFFSIFSTIFITNTFQSTFYTDYD